MLSGNTVNNNQWGIGLGIPSNCNVISDNTVNNNGVGVNFISCSNNTISGNTANSNGNGIYLEDSSSNLLSWNTITRNNVCGIRLRNSPFNEIIGINTIAYNYQGIYLQGVSRNNSIYHNDFISNEVQVIQNCANFWDDGSGGNYWSDYEGIDQDCDGIGDTETPHLKDHYPFIIPLGTIPVYHEQIRYDCTINGSCITVSRFTVDEEKTISFNINGEGYVNLTFPINLLDGPMKVFVDNTPKLCMLSWNETGNSIHFEHKTSVPLEVKIEAKYKTICPEDVNGDGTINILDIAAVALKFGQTCS